VSWVSAIPDVLACAGLFLAPGLLAAYLGGLRGITAWATAPLMTVAVVAAVALLGGFFGFRFGLWSVGAGIVVMACLSAALSLLLRARGIGRPPRDPLPYSLAAGAGAAVAALIGTVTFITGVTRPDAFSETYDAVYHYNAVRYIQETGQASPLTIGTLGQPGSHGLFYPDAWHAMTALLAELTGASILVASTVTCLVIAVLVFPLGCLLLARHLFGASGGQAAAAVVITGLLCSLFGAFPWMLTGYGVLWPNALGMALAPAGVALGLSITRNSADDTFGAVRRWFFGIAGAWAVGVSHPNSALSVAVICVFPLALLVGPVLAHQWRRNALRTTVALLAFLALAVAGGVLASKLGPVQHVFAQSWPLVDTPGRAAVGAFSNGTNGMAAEWVLTLFMLIGVIGCFVWRQRRWLVFAELAIAALYVGSASTSSHVARLFTGLWYDDSHRIAATLPIVAIPLTVTGVLFAGELLRRMAFQAAGAASSAVALGLSVVIGAGVAAVTAVHGVPGNAYAVGARFSTDGLERFDTQPKIHFLETVARLVPPSAVIANDPYQGTAYLYALTGTRVLFPQVGPTTNNQDATYLAQHLVHLSQDQRACNLVRQYGVGYMVFEPDDYLHKPDLPGFYVGATDPAPGSGFQLIAAAGPNKLYKITICQPASEPGGPAEATSQGTG
jgi:hypothetical protein